MALYISYIIFGIILVGILVYVHILRKTEKENLILQDNIAQTQQFYDAMQGRVDGIRKYRHDLRKHIQIVNQFLQEEQAFRDYEGYQKLQDYIREIEEDIEEAGRKTYCEDELLNAICKIKAEECAEAAIPCQFQINVREDSLDEFDPFHITGILMNLLDNAIEACQRCDTAEKGLILDVHTLEEDTGALSLCVGNCVPENFLPDFHTTKKNREEHGLGLGIARDYAGLYRGQLNVDYDEINHYLTISTILRARQV